MDKESGERIEELVRQKLEGKSYTTIRSELEDSGLSKEEINSLIRLVDEKVLTEAVSAGTLDKSRQWHIVGLGLSVIGLVITIAYKTGMIRTSLPPLVVYAPFITGIIIMFYGKMLKGKNNEPDSKGPGAIRRRRPYK